MKEILTECLLDFLKLLPFLFLSFLAVEYVEHRMSTGTRRLIYRAGKAGPLIGSLIGIVPQCGFSAAAAGLFAAGVVSPGTLLAVFLSTSDEMLPILLSEGLPLPFVVKVLGLKVLAGTLIGLLTDTAFARLFPREEALWQPMRAHGNHGHSHHGHGTHGHSSHDHGNHSHSAHQQGQNTYPCAGHDDCKEHGMLESALFHTLHIGGFLFVVSVILEFGMEEVGVLASTGEIFALTGLQEAVSALIGLIPNCATSVLITELYLEGILGGSALMAGLLCSAGTGLLVLCEENHNWKENATLVAILYGGSVLAGLLIGSMGIL